MFILKAKRHEINTAIYTYSNMAIIPHDVVCNVYTVVCCMRYNTKFSTKFIHMYATAVLNLVLLVYYGYLRVVGII